jgi:hypothetical protein
MTSSGYLIAGKCERMVMKGSTWLFISVPIMVSDHQVVLY